MRLHAKVFTIMIMLILITISATLSVGYLEKSNYEIASTFGYPPETEWYKTYGNNDTNDFASGVIPTEDGGYIIAGYLYPFGIWEGESWVMKIDSNGEIIWNKTYDDIHYALCLTTAIDGGYLIVGCKESNGIDDIWLLKIDDNGNEQWNKTYGLGGDVLPYEVIQTENEYLIIGWISFMGELSLTETMLVKFDLNGNFLWDSYFNEECCSIAESDDCGYFLVGENSNDAILIKTDKNGNQLWARNYGKSSLKSRFFGIQKTMDGNFVIVGEIHNPWQSFSELWLLKINNSGDVLIDKTIEGPYDSETGVDVKQTFDKGYVVAGYSDPPPGGETLSFLVKTDSQGNKMWEKKLGGSCSLINNIVHPTKDGGYIAVGTIGYRYLHYDIDINFFVTKFISEDFNSPDIQILKPEDGLYLENKKILELKSTYVFGAINIICEVTDEETGVESVEIYINDELKTIKGAPPYSWFWNEQVFGQFKIKIVANDHAENNYSIEKNVWKFF